MKKSLTNKLISLILSGVIAAVAVTPFCAVSYAAPPSVSVDEAVYVNLDYYGGVSNVSIVKGCDLNGNSSFTDYGSYQSVTNMSGYDKPVLTKDGVKWSLKNEKEHERFYFNGVLKNNAIEFPWAFDVSYKLNGVPVKAEDLAGISGLIEINIKAAPNKKAKEYHKNNMLLQVATYIDMEDTYSLDAPGSQMQSIGSKKAVVFSALPGGEETFTIRIGTNCFETQGITMMMIPGTLEQFKDIKDLKEAKDTLKGSSDAIFTSINEMLRTIESMNSGLTELKSGTAGLEDARSNFSSGKDQMYQDVDQTIEDLNAVNNQLQNLIPYFETGQRMIRSITNDIDDICDTLEDYEDSLNDTDKSITAIQADLTALGTALNMLSSQMNDMLKNMSAAAAVPGGATLYDMAELQGKAAMAAVLGNNMDKISSLLKETIKLGNTTKEILRVTSNLIDDMEDAGDTFNKYEDDMIDLLDDTEQLTTLVNNSLSSTIVCLSYSKTLIQQTNEILDPAMEKSLTGIIDLLDKSIQNMDDIAILKKANSTVKSTVDEQFDKFEKESNLLNLDAEAPLQSFTSDKNPPPATIQVILRTQEISVDNVDSNKDLETEKQDKGIWARIIDIFIEIKEKITSLI